MKNGIKFKTERVALGLTQREVSALARVNQVYISMYERGHYVSKRTVKKLNRAMIDIWSNLPNEEHARCLAIAELLQLNESTSVPERKYLMSSIKSNILELDRELSLKEEA